MNFGLSQEISKDILDRMKVFADLSKNLERYFLDKDFGRAIITLTIGIVCVSQEFDEFFKIRKKYVKTEALAEYDIKLDHRAVKNANEAQLLEILRDNIIDSVQILESLNIENFNYQAFRAELCSFFDNYNNRFVEHVAVVDAKSLRH